MGWIVNASRKISESSICFRIRQAPERLQIEGDMEMLGRLRP